MTRKRRATLSDVAGRAGVSSVTVSRAIRHPEMVSDKLRRKIDEAVHKLNYIPNHLARALASTRTHIVGVIVPSLTNGVFDDYLSAIQDVFVPAGIMVLVSNVRYSVDEEDRAISTLLSYHPEALIVAGIDQSKRSLQLLKRSGIPGGPDHGARRQAGRFEHWSSHENAGHAAVQYLFERGYRRISYLAAHLDPRAQAPPERISARDGRIGLRNRRPGRAVADPPGDSHRRQAPARGLEASARRRRLVLRQRRSCARRAVRMPATGHSRAGRYCDRRIQRSGVFRGQRPVDHLGQHRARQMGTWAATSILDIIRGSGKRPKQKKIDLGFSIVERGSSMLGRAQTEIRIKPS